MMMTTLTSSRMFSCLLVALLLLGISSPVHANDVCTDAVAITSFPFNTNGDVTQATSDFTNPTDNFRNLTCGISTEALGVWYRISPTAAAFLEATVADAPGTSTRFNVALFEGTSCDDMECLLSREYQLENQRTEPRLTWFAKEGSSYFLHVAGINANEVGPFTLNVEQISMADPYENDSCDAARPLTLGAEATATDTIGAWPHGLENDECSLHAYSRGHFYQVATTATGQGIKVTLAQSVEPMGDDTRLEIAVLEEGCQTCVATSDFLTPDDLPHEMEFAAAPGKNYVVLVSGERFSDVGVFQIAVEELETVSSYTNGKLDDIPNEDSEEAAPDATGTFGSTFGNSGAYSVSSMTGMVFSAILGFQYLFI